MPFWYKVFVCFAFVTALIFQSFTLFYISRTYAKAQQSFDEISKNRQEPTILFNIHPEQMTEITESDEPEPETETPEEQEPQPETTEPDNTALPPQNIEEIPDDSPSPAAEPSGESPKTQPYNDDEYSYPDYDFETYEETGGYFTETELLHQILVEIKIIQYITIFAHSCVLVYILYKPIANILR